MGVFSTMRIGMISFAYPTPQEVSKDDAAIWILDRADEWGLGCLHLARLPEDESRLDAIGAKARKLDIEIDLQVSRDIFQLGEPDDGNARILFRQNLETAQKLGARVLRTGYGRLTLETSRFNQNLPLRRHMDKLAKSLQIASDMMKDTDMVLAIENHCDFTGEQLADILDAAGSPRVGAALDTANGYSVYCDPHDDVKNLARHTMTTHIKDMRLVDNYYPEMKNLPLIPAGCELGAGHVDIPSILRSLATSCPYAKNLHLIVEGWSPCLPPVQTDQEKADFIYNSVQYLKNLISKMENETTED